MPKNGRPSPLCATIRSSVSHMICTSCCRRSNARHAVIETTDVGDLGMTVAAPPDNRVLLTGASGFVGQRLAPLLEAVGWSVRCVSRDAARARRHRPHARGFKRMSVALTTSHGRSTAVGLPITWSIAWPMSPPGSSSTSEPWLKPSPSRPSEPVSSGSSYLGATAPQGRRRTISSAGGGRADLAQRARTNARAARWHDRGLRQRLMANRARPRRSTAGDGPAAMAAVALRTGGD